MRFLKGCIASSICLLSLLTLVFAQESQSYTINVTSNSISGGQIDSSSYAGRTSGGGASGTINSSSYTGRLGWLEGNISEPVDNSNSNPSIGGNSGGGSSGGSTLGGSVTPVIEPIKKNYVKDKITDDPQPEQPVKKGVSLFDIGLELTINEITTEQQVLVKVLLINFGREGTTDVNLSFAVKDSDGILVFAEKDQKVVETQLEFVKEIDVSRLRDGSYSLSTVLIYEGQKEPAEVERSFTVKRPEDSSSSLMIVAVLVASGFLVGGLVLISLHKKPKDGQSDAPELPLSLLDEHVFELSKKFAMDSQVIPESSKESKVNSQIAISENLAATRSNLEKVKAN
ncbi:MAG: hypothetical protein AABX51_01495 [Nanoarchaeota archaeon]